MANENVAQTPGREVFNLGKGSERVSIATEATYQIESIICTLMRVSYLDPDSLPHLLRGIGARIFQLNAVIMLALTDEETTEADIRRDLYGAGEHPCYPSDTQGAGVTA